MGENETMGFSFEKLESLTDIEDALKLYRNLKTEEEKIHFELKQECSLIEDSKRRYDHTICKKVPKAFPQILEELKGLERSMKDVDELMDSVVSPLSQLYEVRSAAIKVMKEISCELELKNAINVAEIALNSKDYHRAANTISPYIDKVQVGFTLYDSITRLQSQLFEIIDSNIMENFDTSLIELYTILGDPNRGSDTVTRYIRDSILSEFEKIFHEAMAQQEELIAQNKTEKVSYSVATLRFVKKILSCLRRGGQALEPLFGLLGTLKVIYGVYRDIPGFFVKFIDSFFVSWNYFEEQLRLVNAEYDIQDDYPRDFAQLLDQFALFYQAMERYYLFVSDVTRKSEELVSEYKGQGRQQISDQNLVSYLEKNEKKILHTIGLLREEVERGILFSGMTGLFDYYLIFEGHYIQRSIEMISRESANCRNWSVFIDDIFFIFRESFNRAKSTYNSRIFGKVIALINSKLENDIYEYMKTTQQFSMPSHKFDNSSLASFAISINNLEQVVNYLDFLKGDSQKSIASFDKMQQPIEAIKETIEKLEFIEAKFQVLLDSQMNHILTSTNVLDTIASLFFNCNCTPVESQGNSSQTNDLWVYSVLEVLELLVDSLQSILSSRTLMLAYLKLAKFTSLKLESVIMKKKFNSLGAERVDQSLLLLTSFFIKLNPNSRDSFSRLLQMASLLSIESLYDFQQQKHKNFSIATIKKVLGLRVEFSPEEIEKAIEGLS